MLRRRPTLIAAAAAVGAAAGVAAFGSTGGPASAQTPATTPSAAKAQLAAAKTFMPALGVSLTKGHLRALGTRDLVVIDGDDATAKDVATLHAEGALVLGYLSVGTVESWRPWFSKLKAYRLEPMPGWPGERYTKVSDPAARDALAGDIAPGILKKGFDGLFLDNVDMLDTHPEQQDGMLNLVTRLAALVHGSGGLLMAQNGDDIIEPFIPLLDAWNREDATNTYDFDTKQYVLTDTAGRRSARAEIGLMRSRGVVATTTDYAASPTSRAARHAIKQSCKAGAIPFVGGIDLDRIPAKPARC